MTLSNNASITFNGQFAVVQITGASSVEQADITSSITSIKQSISQSINQSMTSICSVPSQPVSQSNLSNMQACKHRPMKLHVSALFVHFLPTRATPAAMCGSTWSSIRRALNNLKKGRHAPCLRFFCGCSGRRFSGRGCGSSSGNGTLSP